MFVHKYKRRSWLNICENMMVVQSFSPPVCSSSFSFWMKRSPTGLLKDFREENWMKRSPTSRNSEEVVGRKGRWLSPQSSQLHQTLVQWVEHPSWEVLDRMPGHQLATGLRDISSPLWGSPWMGL